MCSYIQHIARLIHMPVYTSLLLWQYRAYVMDSVSSGQAIITSHRHSWLYIHYWVRSKCPGVLISEVVKYKNVVFETDDVYRGVET